MSRYPIVSDEELQKALDAYFDNRGNKSEAARSLSLRRSTYIDRLDLAERKFKVKLGKVAEGSLNNIEMKQMPLPKKKKIGFYLCTSAQNNTHLHQGWQNIIAYADWLQELPIVDFVYIKVGTFVYNKASYGSKSVKIGHGPTVKDQQDLWYDPELSPYIDDEDVLLAPGLVWAGTQNMLPTRKFPLSNKADLNGRLSNLIPHSKMHVESVPSMADEYPKLNMSTGTVTLKNYIKKDAGLVAEQEHMFGFKVIQVDDEGAWYPFEVEIDQDDGFYDVGPRGFSGVYVNGGRATAIPEGHVTIENSPLAAINWGDTHGDEMDLAVREMNFAPNGILDIMKPQYQFHNDLYSHRRRSHHEIKDFLKRYKHHSEESDNVEEEIEITADVLADSDIEWCETIVVSSNHDRHLERWINEADFRQDPANAKYFCYLMYNTLKAIDDGEKDFNLLEFALRSKREFGTVRFLGLDENFVICRKSTAHPGIECGLHGDLGPNGSGGSTKALLKLGRPINKGHDHRATRMGLVISAGACASYFNYMKGPSSHSIAHIFTFKNAARTLVIVFGGKWRA